MSIARGVTAGVGDTCSFLIAEKLWISMERRSYSGPSAPAHVSKRLFATVVMFIGVICIFGGYLLGRMSRTELKHHNGIFSTNLTLAADILYLKATRMPPKSVHHNDPEKIWTKLNEIFQCDANECSVINNYNLADFIRNSLNLQLLKLINSINNASAYLDSLR